MKHFLAYGNSDQASFRHPDVRECFDYMTVPGTIAAFYEDATAAFVLTSGLDYIIDLRTPLFQTSIERPRASHFALSKHFGSAVSSRLLEAEQTGRAAFPPTFYTASVVGELVNASLHFQRSYGERAVDIRDRLERYQRLLAEALGRAEASGTPYGGVRRPSFLLAPYFVADNPDDPWWGVVLDIWRETGLADDSTSISAVVAIADPVFLPEAVSAIPEQLAQTAFYWINGFDERRATQEELDAYVEAVQLASGDRHLVNLYGGFLSICLQHVGLWGFSNGLGYSESRKWPALGATGAVPPRYYVPELHAFVPQALAQAIHDIDPWFNQPTMELLDVEDRQTFNVVGLDYHGLKRHFALARKWEIRLASSSTTTELSERLDASRERFRNVLQQLPTRTRVSTSHLGRWATSLRQIG